MTSATSLGSYYTKLSAPDEAGYQTVFKKSRFDPRKVFKRASKIVEGQFTEANTTTMSIPREAQSTDNDAASMSDPRIMALHAKVDFMVAAYRGQIDEVQELLQTGLEPNFSISTEDMPDDPYPDRLWILTRNKMAKGVSKLTPVYVAAFGGHINVVHLLIEYGAAIPEEHTHRSSILYTLSGAAPKLARILRSTDPYSDGLDSIDEWVMVLDRALSIGRLGDITMFYNLFKSAPDADVRFTYALTTAVKQNKAAVAKLMLYPGTISLRAPCFEEMVYNAGGCPLCMAKAQGFGNLVALLLRSGQVVGCNELSWKCPRWETVAMSEKEVWSADDWEKCHEQ